MHVQGITDRNRLLDLTNRACTKRYLLYMHKMNKRENVRAAVDLACLGLTSADPSGSGSLPQSAHSAPAAITAAAIAPVLPSRSLPELSAATTATVTQRGPQDPTWSAASVMPLASATATTSAETLKDEESSLRGSLSSQAEGFRRSARRLASVPSGLSQPSSSDQAQAQAQPQPQAQAESQQPSLSEKHDWVNPSSELLATLRQELDLELRDAPGESDGSGGGESGSAKKCRPWHWLQEMRQTSCLHCYESIKLAAITLV